MLDECAGLARDSGIPVLSLGLEDATRAAPDFLETVMRAAAQAGFGRLRLADTLGVAAPWEMAALVRRAKAMSGIEIGVHTHNDFGMASANAVAAIEAGADWADVSVLGLGERAGCARLEEVAGWLALARGWPGYRLEGLRPLSAAVARLAGLEVAGSHPLVGRDIFACETGLHLVGLFRNPATYEPFEPSLVGGERRLLLGGKAGRGAVRAYFGKRGRDLGGEGLNRLTSAIRAQAEKLRRPLRAGELEGLAKGVNG